VAPRFGEQQRPSRGAMQLQSWLNLAKQRALRDQRPRGIRMPSILGTTVGSDWYAYITELQVIELPEVFTGGQLWVPDPRLSAAGLPVPSNLYQFVLLEGVEVGDPTNPPFELYDVIDPGLDFGEEKDRVRRIVRITWLSATSCALMLDRELRAVPDPNRPPPPPAPTASYRILRKNRPMPGEPVLTLPKEVGIDISRSSMTDANGNPLWYRFFPPTGNTGGNLPFDILFDPSGRVIGTESTLGSRICLWVRDVSSNFTGTQLPDGDNSLITIYTRTGQIAAHPVDPTGLVPNSASNPNSWNPFRFTQDARSSGGQ
jgi:hypothetical protein